MMGFFSQSERKILDELRPMLYKVRAPFLILFAGILAYSNTFFASFHLDDEPSIAPTPL